jgi:phytanoyl-CoA hydroxylase
VKLSTAQLHQFTNDGYLVARGALLPSEDLQPVMDEYAQILDRMGQRLHAANEISSTYKDLPFGERAIAIARESGHLDTYPFDINFPPYAELTPDTELNFGPAMFGLLRNERLLNTVESIIGPEIYSNPVQHVRVKLPEHLVPKEKQTSQNATTGWHQDNGVVTAEADDTEMLTVWLPLTEASEQHGCLKLVPRSHVEGLQIHCPHPVQGARIPIDFIPDNRVVTVPMSPGDVLLMHRRCMHASLINQSQEIRWSLDIRYNPLGQATGRDFLPGFVARSRNDPSAEFHDPDKWRQRWFAARDDLLSGNSNVPRMHRWDGSHELCA